MASNGVLCAGQVLNDASRPLKERFRALFVLRSFGGSEAVDQMAKAFEDKSALLKHEVAYCLGQMGNPSALPILERLLSDPSVETIVRHEAGEALGAIGNASVLPLLKHFLDDPVQEVADTCKLAVERIEYFAGEGSKGESLSSNPYDSVDPAPPSTTEDVSKLSSILMDDKETLFKRYRALFALRNVGTGDCIKALGEGN